MPPRMKTVGKVVVTPSDCECGYRTAVYAYPDNAYVELAAHMVQTHGSLSYYIAVVFVDEA
ncbi:MAG: hypothetical protein QW680_09335 [Pyrobaculum sp.]